MRTFDGFFSLIPGLIHVAVKTVDSFEDCFVSMENQNRRYLLVYL